MRVERALDKLHALLTRRGVASTATATVSDALPPKSIESKIAKRSAGRSQALDTLQHNEERMKAAARENPKMTPAQARAIDEQTNAELLTSVRNAFGDAATQTMEVYNATLPLRGAVDELAKALFYSSAPMNASQAEQLIQVVAQGARDSQGKINGTRWGRPISTR